MVGRSESLALAICRRSTKVTADMKLLMQSRDLCIVLPAHEKPGRLARVRYVHSLSQVVTKNHFPICLFHFLDLRRWRFNSSWTRNHRSHHWRTFASIRSQQYPATNPPEKIKNQKASVITPHRLPRTSSSNLP